ncbi:LytTR family DNA-binding domain-containing protein [uncultured Roseobacter sp.]|uniref:LytTR family DNA-binding domain-containing protein n=1 Tax=uncultured Roseobacter sp. TaxID=114847 RepID=UPI002615EACA|nr:LytTR family DNA-binding domain-containing protein [uncultured Roseobacter sp.]
MKDFGDRAEFDTGLIPTILMTMFGSGNTSWLQLAKYCVAFSAVGGLVITSLDPVATAHYPIWLAVLHWFSHLFVAACLLAGMTALGVLLGARMPLPFILAVCLLPVFLALFSLVTDAVLDGDPTMELRTQSFGRLYLAELAAVAPPSLGLSALVAIFAYRAADIAQRYRTLLRSRHLPEPSLRSALPAAPMRLGDDLIHAEAQDHYVTVTTANGRATLKLSFSECVSALKGFHGMQCHRSHWVRFKYVQKIKPAGSAYVCILEDGTVIPVSRRRYRDLKRNL